MIEFDFFFLTKKEEERAKSLFSGEKTFYIERRKFIFPFPSINIVYAVVVGVVVQLLLSIWFSVTFSKWNVWSLHLMIFF